MAAPASGTAPTIDALLREVVTPVSRGPWDDVRTFVAQVARVAPSEGEGSTVARAIRGGARADRLGYAFVAGYFAALDGLDPEGAGRTACVAATEVAGVHPRAIETTLSRSGGGLVVRGQKTFVTLADLADDLLVVARRDDDDARGRKQLVALRIPADRVGLRIETRPPTAFAPEVPHARVLLEDVEVAEDEVLPGDGWDDWLRPFRTVEDVHVLGATAGHLLALAAAHGRLEVVGPDLAAVVAIALGIEREGWAPSGGHVALEGAFRLGRAAHERLIEVLPEAAADERRRLERDAPLLLVAEAARQKRLAGALGRITERG